MHKNLARLLGAPLAAAAMIVPGAAQAGVPAPVAAIANAVLAPCSGDLAPAFAQFGDPSNYQLVNGGSFEGKTSWSFGGGAGITTGNESFALAGRGDASSLALPAGGSGLSGAFCVAASTPTIRLVERASSPDAVLRVDLVVANPLAPSRTITMTAARIKGTTAWAPSPIIPILAQTLLGVGTALGGQAQVQLVAESGSWQVDDVYLDPFKKI